MQEYLENQLLDVSEHAERPVRQGGKDFSRTFVSPRSPENISVIRFGPFVLSSDANGKHYYNRLFL